MMIKEPICFKHDKIIELCVDILNEDYSKKTCRTKIKKKINKIIRIAEKARDNGQSMEDRLQIYHDGIVDIGFKRVKKRINN